MYCQKCGMKLEDDWKCCPKCNEGTFNKAIIARNEDKQGCFGFFSGCVTVPLWILGILFVLGVVGNMFAQLGEYKEIVMVVIGAIVVAVIIWMVTHYDKETHTIRR